MLNFLTRRAIERLRTGLFDEVAVSHLTLEKDRIENVFLSALKERKSNHLCICGSYGQGKSHTLTYLNQLALSEGYATSVVQLDFREVPFHQFSAVYQAIMEGLSLPDGEKFVAAWKRWAPDHSLEFLETMPHRFKMILIAMVSKGLTPQETALKKHPNYRPKEFGHWLTQGLMGYDIPAAHLKSVCKYREVKGYKEKPLTCKGNEPYFQMIQSLGVILNQMGYKGLLLFFDEAESITQGRLGARVKSYSLLDQFFQTQSFVFPVFAFTDDFFHKVNHEPYENEEIFPKNYSQAWEDLHIFRLQEFSFERWRSLLDPLMQLYAQAYQIDLREQVKPRLLEVLKKNEAQETRTKLKALVNQLDLSTAASS